MTKIYLVYGTSYDDIDFELAHRSEKEAELRAECLNVNMGEYWYEVKEVELVD